MALVVKGWNNDAADKQIVFVHLVDEESQETLTVEIQRNKVWRLPWRISVGHYLRANLPNRYT